MSNIIFTNKALSKMSSFGLSETTILDAYNNGVVEKWTNGVGFNSVKKYNGYEIGVSYFQNEKGIYMITSVWKRSKR